MGQIDRDDRVLRRFLEHEAELRTAGMRSADAIGHDLVTRMSRASRRRLLGLVAAVIGTLIVAGTAVGVGRSFLGPRQSFGGQAASTPASPFACAVTLPNGQTPPGELGSRMDYGNGQLFTGLNSENGVIRAGPGGSVGFKWSWWRGPGVQARLEVVGRRLDNPTAPPLGVSIPDGYGLGGYQVTGIDFPTPGCWEVTATAGSAKLTFVTLVKLPD